MKKFTKNDRYSAQPVFREEMGFRPLAKINRGKQI